MANGAGQRHVIETVAAAGGTGLTFKSFADDRDGWPAGCFNPDGGPHHGGRAAASTTHARDNGVDSVFGQQVRQPGDEVRLVTTVTVAKLLVPNDLNGREPAAEFSFQDGEEFVAAKQPIPNERHALSRQRIKAVGGALTGNSLRRFGPDRVICGLDDGLMIDGHCVMLAVSGFAACGETVRGA